MTDILTTAEVAQTLGITQRTVLRLIAGGAFPNHRQIPAGDYLIPTTDLVSYISYIRSSKKEKKEKP